MHMNKMNDILLKYQTSDKPYRKQTISALLSTPSSIDDYIRGQRKIHKGNAVREVTKAERRGYFFNLFDVKDYISDVVDINHSKKVRQGRTMTKNYKMSLKDYEHSLNESNIYEGNNCSLHFSKWAGVFLNDKNNENKNNQNRLVGYINLIRHGTIIIYASILGHGDYLNDGIMYFLNQKCLEFIINSKNVKGPKIDFILYAGWNDGTIGLQKWKKRNLFSPHFLKIL